MGKKKVGRREPPFLCQSNAEPPFRLRDGRRGAAVSIVRLGPSQVNVDVGMRRAWNATSTLGASPAQGGITGVVRMREGLVAKNLQPMRWRAPARRAKNLSRGEKIAAAQRTRHTRVSMHRSAKDDT